MNYYYSKKMSKTSFSTKANKYSIKMIIMPLFIILMCTDRVSTSVPGKMNVFQIFRSLLNYGTP